MTSCDIEYLSPEVQSEFPRLWYDLAEGSHFWFQGRFAAAQRQLADLQLPTRSTLRGLEVGCGTGVLREQFEHHTAWAIDICDLNLSALAMAAPGRGRRFYYNVLDREPALHQAYDFVIAYDLLEHLERPVDLLQALGWHLRENGYLMVNVPALESLRSVYDAAAGHIRRYSLDSLRTEVAAAGAFRIEDIRYWGLSLVPLLVLRRVLLWGRQPGPAVIERGFKPPGPLVNRFLRHLLSAERRVLQRPYFGTSVLLLARRCPKSASCA